ncbi:hypothetical protein [Arthrobacter sp. Ld5]|uniref:hypothetical protein n=1 Tax=Arthrobacter sp. Ld5 TaxID=649152 RepID=UPI003EBA2B17
MASITLTSNGGDDRLVISTICTHLAVFHEAGYEFTTERKRRVTSVWWDPSTWGSGFRWRKSNSAAQPTILEYTFIQGQDVRRDPSEFYVASTQHTGYFKSSCVYWFVSTSSSSDPRNPAPSNSPNDLGNDARSVNDVIVRFSYNGQERSLRNSS